MIIYNGRSTWAVLTNAEGSVFPMVKYQSAFAAAVGFFAYWLYLNVSEAFYVPPNAHGVAGALLAFLLVFRSKACDFQLESILRVFFQDKTVQPQQLLVALRAIVVENLFSAVHILSHR